MPSVTGTNASAQMMIAIASQLFRRKRTIKPFSHNQIAVDATAHGAYPSAVVASIACFSVQRYQTRKIGAVLHQARLAIGSTRRVSPAWVPVRAAVPAGSSTT